MIAVLFQVPELELEDGEPHGHAIGMKGVEPVVIKDENFVAWKPFRVPYLGRLQDAGHEEYSQYNLEKDPVSHS